jgi:1-pyrroline-5-carboxylate dehydrogenase
MNNFITAVIHENAFDKLVGYIEQAKKEDEVEVLAGGTYDKSKGYFIHPTLLKTTNPHYTTMETELFGPVVTVYVYEDKAWESTLALVNTTSDYGLTGAIIAQDRHFIEYASGKLRHAAGNFYINDKPSGAVVGQQPFGGSRASGTNDKAGSAQNLLRCSSYRLSLSLYGLKRQMHHFLGFKKKIFFKVPIQIIDFGFWIRAEFFIKITSFEIENSI